MKHWNFTQRNIYEMWRVGQSLLNKNCYALHDHWIGGLTCDNVTGRRLNGKPPNF